MQHIVNVSGGKDSGACIELALMRGRPFRAVMADTGNEADVTMAHIEAINDRLRSHNQPPVEVVRNDFSERIAKKREYVRTKWPEKGVPQDYIDRALAVLRPTGIPFLDLCIWKGRFPSRMAQFCTEFLKQEAIWNQVLRPALEQGPVIQWIGVRRDESLARKDSLRLRVLRAEGLHRLTTYAPIIHWTGRNAIDFTRARGGPINPLYREGFTRVGCFPCINASKDEIARIGANYPDVIAIKAEWETIVAEASKRGAATFFPAPTTPEGRAMAASGATGGHDENPYPKLPQVVEWARTGHGGRQTDLIRDLELEGGVCSSAYGLCE